MYRSGKRGAYPFLVPIGVKLEAEGGSEAGRGKRGSGHGPSQSQQRTLAGNFSLARLKNRGGQNQGDGMPKNRQKRVNRLTMGSRAGLDRQAAVMGGGP